MPLPASSGSRVFTLNLSFSLVPLVPNSSSSRTRNLVPGATAYVSIGSPCRSPSAFCRNCSGAGVVVSRDCSCVCSCALLADAQTRVNAKTVTPALTFLSFIRSIVSSREMLSKQRSAHRKPHLLLRRSCKGLKKGHLEGLPYA